MTPFAIIVRARGGGWQILALFPDGRRLTQWQRFERTARRVVKRAMTVRL